MAMNVMQKVRKMIIKTETNSVSNYLSLVLNLLPN